MIISWHLKYFVFGNLWWLLVARKLSMKNPSTVIACFEDIMMECFLQGDETFSCLNKTLCNHKPAINEKDANRTNKYFMDFECDVQITNCSVTKDHLYVCTQEEAVRKLQNITFSFRVKGCPDDYKEVQGGTHTEILCYFILPLSMFVMFLSYHFITKKFSQTSADIPSLRQNKNMLPIVREMPPVEVQIV